MSEQNSKLIIGAAQFGLKYGINNKYGRASSEEICEILNVAWENGIREIDTAQDYGNSEEILGNCLKEIKKDFIVHSKFAFKNISIQEEINRSLEMLKISELGFFYFHSMSDYIQCKNDSSLKESFNNCLGIAVSVYETHELKQIVDDKFVVAIQLPLNLFDCSEEKIRLISAAQKNGKKVYIRSVFLQGLFFMSLESIPAKLAVFKKPLEIVNSICQRNNLDMMSLALGYVKGVINADGILIGVDTKAQLQDNIRAYQTNLKPSVIEEIKKINIENKNLLLPKNWN